jgi:hypothetical protein
VNGPLGELRPGDDVAVAAWVFDALYAFHRPEVGSIIPPGFPAYCCLLHSERNDNDQVHGRPRLEDVHALAEILRVATSTPDHCWFGVWNGWGWLHISAGSITGLGGERPGWRDPLVQVGRFAASAPRVGHQFREYHLFGGPIDAVGESSPSVVGYQAPSLWWPDDRAWIVASEIDLSWTYVGGAEPVIERALAVWPFDGRRVTPDDPILWDELVE